MKEALDGIKKFFDQDIDAQYVPNFFIADAGD